MKNRQLSLEIQSLQRDIERETKILITGPKGCEDLSKHIRKKLKINLSGKTITRIFGEMNTSETYSPSEESLNILCRLIKKDNWEQYKKEYKRKNGKDILFNPEAIIVSNLKLNHIVRIGWKNIYYMEARYLEDYQFVVEFSQNMHYVKGDTFKAIRFEVILPLCFYEKNPENQNECLEGYKPYPDIVIIKEEEECLVI